jgi:NitT/TauT family transport system substrate-binding protein
MKRRCFDFVTVAAVFIAVISLGFAAMVSPANAAEKVRITMDWKIKGTHSAYYVGVKKGYYKAEGLEVTVKQGAGSVKSVKFVGSDQFDFGSADYGTMAKGVMKDIPVRAVFAIKQRSPMAIIALPGSGIKKLADIKGKKLAVSSGDSTSQILPGLLAKNNIAKSSFTLVTVGRAGKIKALLEGKVDAVTGYTSNQLPVIANAVAKRGIKPIAIRYSENGVNLLANGIITQESHVQKNPKMIRAFLRATKKSWQDTIKDRQGALSIVYGYFPKAKKRNFVFTEQLNEVIRLMDSPSTKGKPMGWMAKSDWVETVSLLKKYAGVKGDVKIDRLYTNDLLPN